MGNYIDTDDIKALFDVDTLASTHDETVADVVADIITKREAMFEGYAIRQYPNLTVLRAAQPQQAQLWITTMCIYDLYKRRGAVPESVKEEYNLTLAQLDNFAKTGIPELITTPPVDQVGRTISGNMTEDDQALFPWASTNITQPWKDII